MKLGIAYNIFNGDELLIDSLMRLRKHSDYIVLTYQTKSNVGNEAEEKLEHNLFNIDKSLYDDLVFFEPDERKHPKLNETIKRQLGLKISKKNRCTHFMSIDCDEFYDDEQFEDAKRIIVEKGYKSTACELVNYFHSSRYQMREKKRFVSFICEIGFWTKFKLGKKLPVSVDPSRVCRNDGFHLFNNDDLVMHHMSYVRCNISSLKSKLVNSPNNKSFDDILDDYLDYYSNWTPELPGLNPHDFKNNRYADNNIIIVENPIPLNIKFIK